MNKQSKSNGNSNTRGGSSAQHAKAGSQSHKNQDKKGAASNSGSQSGSTSGSSRN